MFHITITVVLESVPTIKENDKFTLVIHITQTFKKKS